MYGTKISIALCTYNGEKYLELQLDSLMAQTYRDIEIIIVDDGSSDSTLSIIQAYSDKDSRIKVFSNENNLGYVRNFEHAISLCTGDYIALCDQDDIWELNKLERLIANVGDSLLIYHDSQLFNETGDLVKVSAIFNMYQGDSPLGLLFYNCISGHAMMFNKELVGYLAECGPFDPKFYHDWWIAFVAGSYGKIKYLDEMLVRYRQHLDSSTDIIRSRGENPNRAGNRYFHNTLPWLKNCYRVPGKYQTYIGRLIYLLEHKTVFNSFALLYLLVSKYKTSNYINQKSAVSKLNFLRKASFYNGR